MHSQEHSSTTSDNIAKERKLNGSTQNGNCVLITGGAGYIGSVLTAELLGEGYRVKVLDNLMQGGESLLQVLGHERFEFVKGDVRNNGDLLTVLAGVDKVVHLAAIVGDPASKKMPEETKEINLEATKKLVDLSKEKGVRRLVFFSTCSNYGTSDSDKLSDESSPLNPISLYAETKVEAEKYVLSSVEPGFAPCVFRVSTVFGTSPRMRFDLTVNQFVLEALRDRKLILFAPELWRPYIHIRDVARIVKIALRAPKEKVTGEVFNVGSNSMSYTKMSIAELVLKHIPQTEIEVVDKGTDLRNYQVSFEKVARTFSFVPQRTIEDGVIELMSVIQNNLITDYTNKKFYNA